MNSTKEMIDIEVEAMVESDLEEVLSMERLSFSTPWSRQIFLDELRNKEFSRMITARACDRNIYKGILGYGCYWIIYDEVHITNMAVHNKYRRKGIGEQLLRYMIEEARKMKSRLLTLEVRSSNLKAQALYQKFGFKAVAIRKKYYSDPREDALVMLLELKE